MVLLNSQPQIQTTQWFDTTHVVAIGINNYNNGVRSLGKAVNDAVKIAGIIENLKPTEKVKYYFSLAPKSNFSNEVEQEVSRLGGNTYPPTKKGFCELLSYLTETVGKEDRIILYFAGHGIALPFSQVTKDDRNSTSSPSQMKLDDKPQGYLLFQDAVKGDRNTYMKMDELIGSLHKIQCRHGLIILDCCFAGAIEWSLYRGITRQIGDDLVTPSILDRYITKNAWQILTSSSENQVTNEVLNREHEQLEIDHRGSGENSPFVIALRKAIIDGEADLTQPKRGFIHTIRLIDYLREEIESESSESNKLQTPCIFPFPLKHEQTAEFVFLLGGKKLEEIKSDLPKDPEIDEKHNPYLGLLSYCTDDSNIFFGRKRLISQLFDCVKQNKFPLTVVLGASGSGKSSLVKAGLIPKMFPKLENSQDIHKGWVEFRPGLKFSSDRNILACAHTEGVVALWQDGTFLYTLPRDQNYTTFTKTDGVYYNSVLGIDFSPNGDLIASAHIDGTVKLWKLDGSSDEPLILGEPSSNILVRSLRFSPKGDLIASAYTDGTVKLWNLNGSLHKILEGHKSGVTAVDFSPNGNTLASASEDQTVILWDLERSQDLDGLLQRGCEWAEGYLTNNLNITNEDRKIILKNKNP